MKRQIIFTALIVMLGFIFIACDKNSTSENTDTKNGKVELYLLESFKTIGYTRIDEKTVVTKAQPLVTYSNFLSYDPTKFTFKISAGARAAIENIKHSVFGTAFAIKANNELIYTGYFWPSYSSASCDWVIIDPIMFTPANEMKVVIGYPGGLMPGQVVPDNRNDKRIVEIFGRDNKLVN